MAEEESTSCPAAADDEETLTIRVKTVNDKHFEFVVQKSTLISNLKMRIKEQSDVAEDRQRLIYRGKVMKDHETVATHRIESGHTIHMVARPQGMRPSPSSGQGSSVSRSGGRRNVDTTGAGDGAGGEGGGGSGGSLDSLQSVIMGLGESTTNDNGRSGTLSAVARQLMLGALGGRQIDPTRGVFAASASCPIPLSISLPPFLPY